MAIEDQKITCNDANLRQALREMYDCKCQYCEADNANSIDHIQPRVKGGTHSWGNVTLACGPCNSAKNAGDLPDAFAKVAFRAVRLADKLQKQADDIISIQYEKPVVNTTAQKTTAGISAPVVQPFDRGSFTYFPAPSIDSELPLGPALDALLEKVVMSYCEPVEITPEEYHLIELLAKIGYFDAVTQSSGKVIGNFRIVTNKAEGTITLFGGEFSIDVINALREGPPLEDPRVEKVFTMVDGWVPKPEAA